MRLATGSKSRLVALVDLSVEGQEVIDPANAEQARSEEVKDAGAPFAQIEAMEADQSEEGKGLKNPGDGVIVRAGGVFSVCRSVHGWNQEEVDQPTDANQAEGEEPNDAGDWAAEVEAVGTGEPENPEDVADEFAVGGDRSVHSSEDLTT